MTLLNNGAIIKGLVQTGHWVHPSYAGNVYIRCNPKTGWSGESRREEQVPMFTAGLRRERDKLLDRIVNLHAAAGPNWKPPTSMNSQQAFASMMSKNCDN